MVKLEPLSKANIFKVLHNRFSQRNVIIRLFNEQLTTDADLEQAKDILWDLKLTTI